MLIAVLNARVKKSRQLPANVKTVAMISKERGAYNAAATYIAVARRD